MAKEPDGDEVRQLAKQVINKNPYYYNAILNGVVKIDLETLGKLHPFELILLDEIQEMKKEIQEAREKNRVYHVRLVK